MAGPGFPRPRTHATHGTVSLLGLRGGVAGSSTGAALRRRFFESCTPRRRSATTPGTTPSGGTARLPGRTGQGLAVNTYLAPAGVVDCIHKNATERAKDAASATARAQEHLHQAAARRGAMEATYDGYQLVSEKQWASTFQKAKADVEKQLQADTSAIR